MIHYVADNSAQLMAHHRQQRRQRGYCNLCHREAIERTNRGNEIDRRLWSKSILAKSCPKLILT